MKMHNYAVQYLDKDNRVKINLFYDSQRAYTFFDKQSAGEIWFKIRGTWHRIAWGEGSKA
jgi:hypothetical protein